MDHICVKTNKYKQLQQIGKLSAAHLVESESYIRLAMFVEQYMNTNSIESFELVKQQLSICTSNFPNFNQMKNTLLMELMNIGYLSTNEPESTPDTSRPPQPHQTNQSQTNNIVNIFSKRDS